MTKMLWAVKKENEDWQEEIITTQGDRIEEARRWAIENGYDRFRIAEYYDGEVPDFSNTINTGGSK